MQTYENNMFTGISPLSPPENRNLLLDEFGDRFVLGFSNMG